ncbi:GAF sensor-containing diguanylate cyclase [Novosphingobium sp. Rr 2-17]|uniref:sensor domain-containing diguanylate cyclase n=1 Tax=Novosphingobium sp. Rr 2-17 TaxID=555793 RepID=UPI00026984EE|nr:sensor domain-containing diguanylate cyclase [Novosphingobium sp. Rr 2-17]EIZ79990.1 GAF sensor-containing diguanylate cyclase [Novosphingobium sp. Rr 2-17]
MFSEATLLDEPGRLAALHRLAILDTETEGPFEHVVNLVRKVLGVPMCAVSLLDKERQWYKAQAGLGFSETPRDTSFCTHTIKQRTAFAIPDATKDARFADNATFTGDMNVRSYLGIPLVTADGYNVGALCALDTRVREFSQREVDILENFARIIVTEMELRRIAERDQLTGALSRRGFIEKAEAEIERFHRYGRPASLLMVDVDRFKQVNDTWGHSAGDAVLRALAASLERGKRPVDVLGRLGGEEFALLLPETDANDALRAANRLREALAECSIPLPGEQSVTITASFGVAGLDSTIAGYEDWLARADTPLYAAKHSGRNRCVLAA